MNAYRVVVGRTAFGTVSVAYVCEHDAPPDALDPLTRSHDALHPGITWHTFKVETTTREAAVRHAIAVLQAAAAS